MKFFFDTCISEILVKALGFFEYADKPDFAAKIEILHLKTRYPESKDDKEWIAEVAEENYIIITGDWAQKKSRGKHEAESRAYRECNAIAFWLPRSFVSMQVQGSGRVKFAQASLLFKWWPDIKETAKRAVPGNLFDINDKGAISLRLPSS
ncbi:MAG TPA: hypothetical protein VMW12_05920 [Candidatus Dormibacteraeota bacterium]|nr:hypothetical protein [Candidatus Dormibacteraeota bacterium]